MTVNQARVIRRRRLRQYSNRSPKAFGACAPRRHSHRRRASCTCTNRSIPHNENDEKSSLLRPPAPTGRQRDDWVDFGGIFDGRRFSRRHGFSAPSRHLVKATRNHKYTHNARFLDCVFCAVCTQQWSERARRMVMATGRSANETIFGLRFGGVEGNASEKFSAEMSNA